MSKKHIGFVVMFLCAVVSCLRAQAASREDMKLFLWVELIGFDNTQADYGVRQYLDNLGRTPNAVSLLFQNDNLFRCYDPKDSADFTLPPNCCSYGGRPFNRLRKRQDWKASELKGLVTELKKQGVAVVFASFFWYKDMPIAKELHDKVIEKLVPFLCDFGFTGYHGADGYAPPCHFNLQCEKAEDRPKVAKARAALYAENWRDMINALHAKDLKCWMNTTWTLDPYEALLRYGVDYRALADVGLDGFIVESSAAGITLRTGPARNTASRIDKSTSMLIRLKACCPNTSLVLLHGINDGNEQWSALKHARSACRSEVMALGNVFYGNKRALDGFLCCLSDDVPAAQWNEIFDLYDSTRVPAAEPLGLRVVWSDRAFRSEFDECSVTLDCSSNTFLWETLRRGAVIHSSISVADALKDKSIPLMIINPKFFPKEELDALTNRFAPVQVVGLGAIPPDTAPYVKLPPEKLKLTGMPEDNSGHFTWEIPENKPPACIFERAAGDENWIIPVVKPLQKELRLYGYRMTNGRLALFCRNEDEKYITADIMVNLPISDILVHSDFPTKPLKTILQGKVAPMDTMFFSVKERDSVEASPSPIP